MVGCFLQKFSHSTLIDGSNKVFIVKKFFHRLVYWRFAEVIVAWFAVTVVLA